MKQNKSEAKRTEKKSRGHRLMQIGAALVLAALLLLLYNNYVDYQAGQRAQDLLSQLQDQMPRDHRNSAVGAASGRLTTAEVDGQSYIGTVDIPVLDLSLPVIDHWEGRLAKVAPCRYVGSADGGDLIIAGHNYKKHFGYLSSLQVGDAISFTDVNGNVYHYRVSGLETLDKYATEEMEAGDWDLTLFTCTVGGQQRITVRCQSTVSDS